jgi:hypothetical protein
MNIDMDICSNENFILVKPDGQLKKSLIEIQTMREKVEKIMKFLDEHPSAFL